MESLTRSAASQIGMRRLPSRGRIGWACSLLPGPDPMNGGGTMATHTTRTRRSPRQLPPLTRSPLTTVGLDVGDRQSLFCVLDERGDVVEEGRIPTSPCAGAQVREHAFSAGGARDGD